MADAAIDQVRRFNRVVAERIGALEDHFLGRSRPLGEARLLWEIGPGGADVRDLRGRLGLDSGYVSRLLRLLERQGLVTVRINDGDARVRRAMLTKRGLAERRELDKRSDVVAHRMLEPLGEKQRETFLSAMSEIERLLQASMVRFDVEDPRTATSRWCLSQYFAELNERFDVGFDPARSLYADTRVFTRPSGAFVVARVRGRPVGCGAVKFKGKLPAEFKRMWIAKESRGLGLGKRLLDALENQARAAGAKAVRLETNRTLKEAIAMYRQAGYVEIEPFNDEPYAHHWFEKRLSGARKKR
ncbi:MAG TPA: helix-turn-helix domain-containing GNAT family N-acetyltransferase [Gemmatimonadaceae bacterium]|nr:helix-turn-helix domain-containing GNAT family N-acetyltransferase [Gemmatimonadaceae bacterium]